MSEAANTIQRSRPATLRRRPHPRAAKAAALEQYNAMVTFNNSIVDLWNSIPDTYDKYVSNARRRQQDREVDD